MATSEGSSGAWQRALCEELWRLRSAGVLCDVVLAVGGEQLPAHRVVLSAGSPYLRHLCTHPASLGLGGAALIPVDTSSYEACLKALEFLYTGRTEGLGEPGLREHFDRICEDWNLGGLPGDEPTGITHGGGGRETSGELPGRSSCASDKHFKSDPKYKRELDKSVDQNGMEEVPHARQKVSAVGKKRRGRPPKRSTKRADKNVVKTVTATDTVQNPESGEDKQTENRKKPKILESHTDLVISDHDGEDDNVSDDEKDETWEIPTQVNELRVTSLNSRRTSRNTRTAQSKVKLPTTKRKTLLFRRNSCQRCKLVFGTRDEFLAHRRGAHPKVRRLWCHVCDQKFPDGNLLQLHNMEQHWEEGMKLAKKYTCTEAGCSFSSFIYATWHKHRSVHGAEPRVCEVCGKTLKNEFTLKQHVENQHTRTTAYPCDVCTKTFTTKGNLKAHKEARHEDRAGREKLVCPQCAFVCWCKTSMAEHLLLKHDELLPSRTLHVCDSCDFKTTIQAKMKDHRRGHNALERLACAVCGKTYKSVKLLNRHKKIHDNTAKVTRCMYCDYTTLHGVGTLSNHLRFKHRDKDPKPWPCAECGHKAITRDSLLYHLQNVHKRGFTDYRDSPLGEPEDRPGRLPEPTTSDQPGRLPGHATSDRPGPLPEPIAPSLYSVSAPGLLLNHQTELAMAPAGPSGMSAGMPGSAPESVQGSLGAGLIQQVAGNSQSLQVPPGVQAYSALPQGYMHQDSMVNPMYIHSMGF